MADETTIEDLKARIALQETEIGLLREKKEFLDDEAELQSSQLELAKKKLEETRKYILAQGNIKDLDEARQKALMKSLQLMQQEVQQEDARLKAIKASQKASQQLNETAASYFSQITMINDGWKQTALGGLLQASNTAKGLEGSFKAMGTAIKALPMKTFANILGEIEQQTVMMVMGLMNGAAELTKVTGLIDQNFQGQIQQLGSDFSNMALGIQEAQVVLKSLYTEFSNFRNLTKSTQESLKGTTMTLVGLGVDGGTAVQFMDDAMKTFGLSAKESEKAALGMYAISRDLKFTTEELMTELGKFKGYLAAFDNGIEIFENLAIAADRAGMEVSELGKVVQQFDTFEGAARAVGKLNTALGQNYFDMQRMMSLNPDERIEEMRSQLLLAAPDFERMNFQQKRFLATSAGFSDAGELMKFMRGEAAEGADDLKKFGMSQKEIEEIAKNSKAPLQVMQAALQKLAIAAAPLAKTFADVAVEIADFLSENAEVVKYVVLTALGFKALTGAIKTFTGPFKEVKDLMTVAGAAGTTAQAAANVKLAASYQALAPAAAAAAGPLNAITIPMAIIAVSIAVVVIALADLVKHAIDANVPLLEVAGAFAILAGSVGLLALAFASVAAGSPVSAIGIAIVAAAILSLGLALAFVSTDDLQALATIFQSMAKTAATNPFGSWISGIKEFAKEADNLKSDLSTIGQAINQLEMDAAKAQPAIQFVTAISKIDDQSVQGLTQAKELVTQLNAGVNVETVKAIQELIKSVNASTAQAATPTSDRPVEIKLDGKVLGRFVGGVVKKGVNSPRIA
jgi:hypothetical protein